jgi:succinate dehydrogenase / fumarate reductase flavoprotein subunit
MHGQPGGIAACEPTVAIFHKQENIRHSVEQVEDLFGLAELMLRDALAREESCGAHFRQEHRTEDGEALRDDERFCHIAAWEHRAGAEPVRHAEPLAFTSVRPARRDYR